MYRVSEALKKFNASKRYTLIKLKTIQELENILEKSKMPIITDIWWNKRLCHAIVIDAIKEDSKTGLKFVYIRNSIPSSDGSRSYKVLVEDFESRWGRRSIVPTKVQITGSPNGQRSQNYGMT